MQRGLDRLKASKEKLVVYTIHIVAVVSLDIYTDLSRLVLEIEAVELLYYTIFAEMMFVFIYIPQKSLNKEERDDEAF